VGVDVVIPLTEGLPKGIPVGQEIRLLIGHLVDYGGVPDNWGAFLRQQVIPLLETGKKVLAYCVGSHGRTGTFLASLIALLEPDINDPIAAARERHCHHAVESLAQATAIFALKGRQLPEKYAQEFYKPPVQNFGLGLNPGPAGNWNSF
jgi:hypothetical protein